MLDGRTVVTTLSLTNVRDGTISLELEVSLHGPVFCRPSLPGYVFVNFPDPAAAQNAVGAQAHHSSKMLRANSLYHSSYQSTLNFRIVPTTCDLPADDARDAKDGSIMKLS